MSGKAGKGAAGRGKSKGGKSVSRSKKAGHSHSDPESLYRKEDATDSSPSL